MDEVADLTESLLVMSRSMAPVIDKMPARGSSACNEHHILLYIGKLLSAFKNEVGKWNTGDEGQFREFSRSCAISGLVTVRRVYTIIGFELNKISV